MIKKIYMLHDLSPEIKSVIGLPFIIEDVGLGLLTRLQMELVNYHELLNLSRPNDALHEINERIVMVENAIRYLTSTYLPAEGVVKVFTRLSYVMAPEGRPIQSLVTSVQCPICDSTMVYTQPEIIMSLTENLQMWDHAKLVDFRIPVAKKAAAKKESVTAMSYSQNSHYKTPKY